MLFQIITTISLLTSIGALERCPGDTRPGLKDEDFGKCNHDGTHRVCAVIGDSDSSFWSFTRQRSWCGSPYDEDSEGWQGLTRCPEEEPTWCICKWATEEWINGVGCGNADIYCPATDVCNLKQSYIDGTTELHNARLCIQQKCAQQWIQCP